MKLELVKYKCARCKREFETPELSPVAYGEFLLRSPGETVHLDALSDKTYEEVDAILSQVPEGALLNPGSRASLLRKIYGRVACDTDDEGNEFVLGAHPPCPSCNSQDMECWEFIDPVQLVELTIPAVQHTRWDALNTESKVKAVRQEAVAHK